LTFAFFYMSAHSGLHVADEGLQWYGSQRTLSGEMPLRDFWGYDPLRYYWSAAVMWLLGSRGVVAATLAEGLASALGLWLALRLIFRGRSLPPWWLCLPIILIFLLWMVPRFKSFDVAASVVLVATLAWLLEDPVPRRCYLAGACVGVIAMVGRNHGLYGAVAEVVALAYLAWGGRARFLPAGLRWSLGLLIGYSPVLLAAAFVPGFWPHLLASIRVYFELGATNATLPVPWPWYTLQRGLHSMQSLRTLLQGILLLMSPLSGFAILVFSCWRVRTHRPVDPVLLAAGLLAIPYTHHALGRADLEHLGQAGAPMLIGACVLLTALPRPRAALLATTVLVLSLFMFVEKQPLYQEWSEGDWVSAPIGTDTLRVPPDVAQVTNTIRQLVQVYAPPPREFLAQPLISVAYAMADRRAAVWDVYASADADDQVQQDEIRRIQAERPAFVLFQRKGIYSVGSRAYPTTHPLVYQYIVQHYVRVKPGFVPEPLHWEVYLPASAVTATGRPEMP
jgi:hypothetical protein